LVAVFYQTIFFAKPWAQPTVAQFVGRREKLVANNSFKPTAGVMLGSSNRCRPAAA